MSIEKLGRYFVAVEDPRCFGKVEHRLVKMLVIAMSTLVLSSRIPPALPAEP